MNSENEKKKCRINRYIEHARGNKFFMLEHEERRLKKAAVQMKLTEMEMVH